MVTNHTIIEWTGVILAFLFGITMICQGHFIFHGKHGYKHVDREKKRLRDIRSQIEKLLKEK